MNSGLRVATSRERLAMAAIILAALLLVWQLVAAARITPTAPLARATPVRGAAPMPRTDKALTAEAIAAAVARDPFSATREPPAVPYRLAEPEQASDVTGETVPIEAAPLPDVRGTAVGPAGDAFAMCAWDGGPVMVVRAGDTLGPYTVLTIERARVTFRDGAGRRVTVDAIASPDGTAP